MRRLTNSRYLAAVLPDRLLPGKRLEALDRALIKGWRLRRRAAQGDLGVGGFHVGIRVVFKAIG